MTGLSPGRVTPFGHPRITGCLLLPVAFRSLPRPSSPNSSEASSMNSFSLDHILSLPLPMHHSLTARNTSSVTSSACSVPSSQASFSPMPQPSSRCSHRLTKRSGPSCLSRCRSRSMCLSKQEQNTIARSPSLFLCQRSSRLIPTFNQARPQDVHTAGTCNMRPSRTQTRRTQCRRVTSQKTSRVVHLRSVIDRVSTTASLLALEVRGFEPLTYGLQSHRSSQLSYTPGNPD
jgi:hypothetical protein